MDDKLLNHPDLNDINPEKLKMLLSFADQAKGKKQNELLPFLMAAASATKKQGNGFSKEETDLIVQVLKQGKSKEEVNKIDRLCALLQSMKH